MLLQPLVPFSLCASSVIYGVIHLTHFLKVLSNCLFFLCLFDCMSFQLFVLVLCGHTSQNCDSAPESITPINLYTLSHDWIALCCPVLVLRYLLQFSASPSRATVSISYEAETLWSSTRATLVSYQAATLWRTRICCCCFSHSFTLFSISANKFRSDAPN
jgi:hypothetical protein